MIHTLLTELSRLADTPNFAIDVALKATLLLLVAFAIDRAFGQRRSLVRSAVWNACVVGLLLLPLATLALPRVTIECLPAPTAATPAPGHAGADSAAIPAITVDPSAPAAPASTRVHWIHVLGAAYLAGVAILALQLAGSLLAVTKLRRTAVAVTDPQWLDALERRRRQLGIASPVVLAACEGIDVPVAVGSLRPAILLPDSALASEDPTYRDAVLLHELAHIRRNDYFRQFLLRVAQAVYWPHPLVWVAGRLIAGAREQACDDLCVHYTASAETYRDALIRVAASLAGRPLITAGTAFARSTRIGRRLDRIGAGFRSERALAPWPVRASIASVAIAMVMTLGPTELGQRPAMAGEPEASPARPVVAPQPVAPPAAAPVPATRPALTGPLPSVRVDEPVYNFGNVVGVNTIEHTFKLRNVGNGELKIESVQPTCGCTVAGPWAKTVAPGATWSLPITLRINADGTLNKHIIVKTSDPAHPQVDYSIAGNARGRFEFIPSRTFMMGQLQKDSVVEKFVTIVNRMDTPIVLKSPRVDSPLFEVDLRELQAGRRYELRIKTRPPLPVGRTNARVAIDTDSKDEPTIQLPVFIEIAARVSVVPQVLTWPIPIQRNERRPIIVRNTGPNPIRITDVRVSDPTIQIETKVITEGKQYQIWLAVPGGTVIPPTGWTVTVSTDDPEFRSLTVPVRGYAAPTTRPAMTHATPPAFTLPAVR